MSDLPEDREYMARALALARRAAAAGEVPVGAVLVDADGTRVLAEAANETEAAADPTAHAEVLAIRRAAAASGRPRLPGTTLYVTLEPCTQCAAAISFARVARVVFAAEDAKGGAVVNGIRFYEQATCHHRPAIARIDDAGEAAALLRGFFRARRRPSVDPAA
jgi:tRNA(Arg) A34 adenosine deaminase TadA